MIAYKLFRIRKDGSLGSLFINRTIKLPLNKWLEAEDHKTKGYKHRPGWHCCPQPQAPHLSMKDREWFEVEINNYETEHRPESQGGLWFLANNMKIIRQIS